MDASQTLREIISAHVPARAVQVGAHLGLPDLVRGGADTAEALSQAVGIDAWRIGRLMRFLVAVGVFTKSGERYKLSELGSLLCRDTPGTLRNSAVLNYYNFSAWTELETGMRTRQSGYKLSTGRSYFEAVAAIPEFAEAFDLAMNEMFVPETKALVEKYDFGQYRFLLDVGGGNGEVLINALKAYPNLTGCLFDLPHVVERAASRVVAEGVEDRCTRVGGSFFDPLPLKADAILLRHILHDWQEEDAIIILKRCREALKPNGVLLIGEAIIEDAETLTVPLRLDLMMMTFFDGAERTLEEYRELVGKAGLEISAVITINPVLSIMEARAV